MDQPEKLRKVCIFLKSFQKFNLCNGCIVLHTRCRCHGRRFPAPVMFSEPPAGYFMKLIRMEFNAGMNRWPQAWPLVCSPEDVVPLHPSAAEASQKTISDYFVRKENSAAADELTSCRPSAMSVGVSHLSTVEMFCRGEKKKNCAEVCFLLPTECVCRLAKHKLFFLNQENMVLASVCTWWRVFKTFSSVERNLLFLKHHLHWIGRFCFEFHWNKTVHKAISKM